VADEEHAAVAWHGVQPACGETPPYRCRAQSNLEQLRTRHDAALPRGELGDGVIDATRVEF
jgi:hypothetical protein